MIENLSPHTSDMVLTQTEARARWVEYDTLDRLDAMLLHEGTHELEEAVELCMLGASAFVLASEIGDVFYLAIKRASLSPDFTPEILVVMQRATELAELTGIDIDAAVRTKIFRNDLKYLHHFSNNQYSYAEGIDLSRQQYQLNGGDVAFSELYLYMV